MKFSSSEVLPVAESTGFKAVMVEKVLHLLNLLNTLNSHPFLKGKWALKGGTALNMFRLEQKGKWVGRTYSTPSDTDNIPASEEGGPKVFIVKYAERGSPMSWPFGQANRKACRRWYGGKKTGVQRQYSQSTAEIFMEGRGAVGIE